MAAYCKHARTAGAVLLMMVCLQPKAWGNEVQVSGPDGEAAAHHAPPQVQVWSCRGSVSSCRILQGGKREGGGIVDSDASDVALVLPKFRPRVVARRAKGRP